MVQSLLYKDEIRIDDHISIYIPKVGEVIDHEDEYYGLVSLFTAMPIDMMVQLDDAGIDFTTITEWDLFLLLFDTLKERDLSMVLRGVDLKSMRLAPAEDSGQIRFMNDEGAVLDRKVHAQIANSLRQLHGIEKDKRQPANEEAKKYLIKRARVKAKRRAKMVQSSQLEDLIVSMVNTEQFKYKFSEVRDLTIYQFNASVRQVVRKVDYDNRMYGVYTGTISAKDLSQKDLNWLTRN